MAKKPKPQKKKSGAANRLFILLMLAALVPFSLPTLLVLVVGMMPMLGAVLMERGPHRYAWICVGGLNFAGLAPWLFQLWFGNHTMAYAIDSLTGITMLLVAYGAAAAGWALYMGVPPVVHAIMKMTSVHRVDKLNSLQKQLADQWGENVSR